MHGKAKPMYRAYGKLGKVISRLEEVADQIDSNTDPVAYVKQHPIGSLGFLMDAIYEALQQWEFAHEEMEV